ncbi:hypothetical protein EDEG_02601 [Edhazardia aedis USNM 41457]|uniref:Amino acid transporter transmembrane domain-containing protein n=1 Tax=Edhazardia aedis (strain USNM 41457) TaxID=1003232 RepID=J9D653_EDHAE|nr:hypothetical protein EDEG_02601 [Edhazardia aedis USNM 41457]|eukprot:EJW03019.1 hypothetical protein EDEG_02601 [Edhazardia aedis USNM 41457]
MKKTVFLSIYFNLLKTIMGYGILNFPVLFYKFGLIRTIFLLIVSGTFSTFGLMLYTISNRIINKKSNMSTLSLHIFPRLKLLIDFCVSAKCFAVALLYLEIAKKLISLVQNYLRTKENNILKVLSNAKNSTILVFLLLGTAPLSFFDQLHQLKYVSIFGMFCIFLMIASAIYMYFQTNTINEIKFWPKTDESLFKSLGQFVYAFTCHQNIFTIQNEMEESSLKPLNTVIISVILSTIAIYTFYGLINVKIFGDLLQNNMIHIMEQENTFITTAVFFLFLLMLILSYPLQINPCRLYFMSIFNKEYKKNRWFGYITTTSIILSTYALTIPGFAIEKLANYIGGSVSSCMCFIFCSIFYIKIKENKKIRSIMAWSTLLFGLFAMICFFGNILMTN